MQPFPGRRSASALQLLFPSRLKACLGPMFLLFWPQPPQHASRQPLGLMTSLPLYWPLGGEMDALVRAMDELWSHCALNRAEDAG